MDDGFDNLRDTLALRIRALRESRCLSQEQLAFDAEIDRTYVSQLERGICNPSLKILFKVAVVLNTSIPELLQ